jgi:hypothetical protein
MLAMGLGLTVSQIIAPLRNSPTGGAVATGEFCSDAAWR